MFDTTDIQRFAVSLIGALLLSAACVIGAVGPARASSASATSEHWGAADNPLSCSPAIPLKLQ